MKAARCCLVLGLSACLAADPAVRKSSELPPEAVRAALQFSPLGQLPPDPTNAWADDPRAARFGKLLFGEPRLSRGGTVSCATCHDPRRAFTDGLQVAQGRATGRRNTPSIADAAWRRWYLWDGRADTLWAQALGPIESSLEMGSTRLDVVRVVAADPVLSAAYESAFVELPALSADAWSSGPARPVPAAERHPHDAAWRALPEADRRAVDAAFVRIGKSIAAFERTLRTPRSRFDDFVEALRQSDPGSSQWLGPSAARGLVLFVGRGRCTTCHSGPLLSDGEFHDIRLPVLEPGGEVSAGRFEGLGRLLESDFRSDGAFSDDVATGRRKLTGLSPDQSDLGAFRTPSLRGVSRTAPYMHDGRFAALGDVVEYYSRMQAARPVDALHGETILVPLELNESERADLVAFLEML